jgi:hypothetical protein
MVLILVNMRLDLIVTMLTKVEKISKLKAKAPEISWRNCYIHTVKFLNALVIEMFPIICSDCLTYFREYGYEFD